ncbi:MAG: hypothetical protein FJ109_05890 [Deltaproteobacteria bacterium]|nr:hypothetical protein [Deltaproteobacteria bacterium]
MKKGRYIRWLVLALLVPGCFVMEEPLDTDGEVATCLADSDCGDGLVCDLKARRCVADSELNLSGWLRLVPPGQGVLGVEEQYAQLDLSSREELTLKLHRPIRVVGRVLIEGNPLSSEKAKIVAVAPGSIPDLTVHQEAKVAASSLAGGEKPGFELWVSEDVTYDVYVYLPPAEDGQEYPPYHVRRQFSRRSDPADPFTFDWQIEVPPPSSYLQVTGCLVKEGTNAMPLAGARVNALSAPSGNVSSTATSDEAGCFVLLVQPPEAPEGDPYEVRLQPSPENELVPKVAVADVVVVEGTDLGVLAVSGLDELLHVSVVLTAKLDTPSSKSFSGRGADEQARQMAQRQLDRLATDLHDAVVRLTGQVGDGMLEVERTVENVEYDTDLAAGRVQATARMEFDVPPRSYVLSVIPAAESRLGIYQQLVHYYAGDVEAPDLQVFLEDKALTRIRLEDTQEMPVSGAQVMGILSGKGKYPETAPLPTRKFQAEEDPDTPGLYRVSLDPGEYTLVVDPLPESGLPRFVERELFVSGASQQRTFTVPPPAALTGLVLGTTAPIPQETKDAEVDLGGSEPAVNADVDQPISGVLVELYDETEGLAVPDGSAPIPLASGFTDADGRFVLLVPAE